jgi:hypothetical protein
MCCISLLDSAHLDLFENNLTNLIIIYITPRQQSISYKDPDNSFISLPEVQFQMNETNTYQFPKLWLVF